MKKTLLILAAAFTVFGAAAQNRIVNNPDNKAYFGARLSLDAAIPGDVKTGNVSVDALGNGPGISIGAIYNQPIIANFYVEPGLELYYNAVSINQNDVDNVPYAHKSLRKFGLRVPVQLGYHFDFSKNFNLSVFTGPVLDVGLSDDYYLTTKEYQGQDKHSSGSVYHKGGLNRVDCKWRIGIGTTFLKNYYVSLSGDIGMCNMINKASKVNTKMHENGFHLTLGYNF